MKNCTNCGAPRDASLTACPYCGGAYMDPRDLYEAGLITARQLLEASGEQAPEDEIETLYADNRPVMAVRVPPCIPTKETR